jgi:hypothetical protein
MLAAPQGCEATLVGRRRNGSDDIWSAPVAYSKCVQPNLDAWRTGWL